MALFAKTAIVCSPSCSASCVLLVALDCVDCRNNVACNRQPGRWCSQCQKLFLKIWKISPLSQIGCLAIALKHLGNSLSLPSFLLLWLVVSFVRLFFRGEVQQLDLAWHSCWVVNCSDDQQAWGAESSVSVSDVSFHERLHEWDYFNAQIKWAQTKQTIKN